MKRLLLVDDDADILEGLELGLEDRYQISLAGNGAEALALIRQQRFDAVVLDLMMPILDGAGFLEAIRDLGIRVPVIIASAGPDLVARARELQVPDWIAKPFELSWLEQKLERLLDDGPR